MTRSLWLGLGACLLSACVTSGNATTSSGSGSSGATSTSAASSSQASATSTSAPSSGTGTSGGTASGNTSASSTGSSGSRQGSGSSTSKPTSTSTGSGSPTGTASTSTATSASSSASSSTTGTGTSSSGSTSSSSGGAADGGVLPPYDDATANWANAGLLSVGGIPTRTTVCATVNPLGGGQDDFTNIQNAINNCPAGQVVQLGAGAFTVHIADLPIQISTGITLRGNGRLRRLQLALLPDLHQRVRWRARLHGRDVRHEHVRRGGLPEWRAGGDLDGSRLPRLQLQLGPVRQRRR